MMNKNRIRVVIALSCISLSTCMIDTAFAEDVSIGRYLSVEEKPLEGQRQLLKQQIQVQFPTNILTIQQAIEFILQFSGFHLAESSNLNHSVRERLQQSLPEVDRVLGPITLEQALLTLTGEPFYLLLDPVHQLIAFELRPPYKDLYETSV